MLKSLFSPKHTFDSVVRELADGLTNGAISLSSADAIPSTADQVVDVRFGTPFVRARQVGDVVFIEVKGQVREGSVIIRKGLEELLSQGHKKLVLNLGDISYIDSSGLGELVSVFTMVTNHGGQLRVVGLNKRLRDLLRITKLGAVFDDSVFLADEREAFRSFE